MLRSLDTISTSQRISNLGYHQATATKTAAITALDWVQLLDSTTPISMDGTYRIDTRCSPTALKVSLFEAGRVTDAGAPSSGDRGITLFHQEHPGYAGDGILHRYSIEMDLRSNRTIWIVDDSVIATFRISFVPSVIVFYGSSSDVGNFAVASLQDPIQVAVPTAQASNNLVSSLQNQITSLNGKIDSLEAQVARLPSQNPLWFSQWWFSIIWGLLGAGLGALLFMKAPALRMRMRGESVGLIGDQGNVACPQCGILMPFSSIFCGGCGNKLRKAKLSCPQCGGQMPLTSVFCGICGTRLREMG